MTEKAPWLRRQWVWDLKHFWNYTVKDKGWEKSWMWIAWHLPRPLVRWCAVRVGAHATTGKYGDTLVPDLTFMDALQRWEDKGTRQ